MEDFAIEKMIEGTFDSEEALYSYKQHDYTILGDKKAFMLYYQVTENVVWVHFLWASNPRQMYSVLKKFEELYNPTENLVLFDSDEFLTMFGNHARKVFIWEKELK